MGLPLEKISKLVGKDVNVVNNTLSELQNVIESLEPQGFIDHTKPKTLWLFTTPQCNLRCSYCYTSSGSPYGGTKNLTTEEVIKAVEKILDAFPSIDDVIFFGGGEPLLNPNVIIKVMEEFDNRIKHFSIITNGTLISKYRKSIMDLLSYRNKLTFTVSVDGPQIVHDIHRVYPDGRGSYNDVIEGLTILKNHNFNIQIQAVYTDEAILLGYSLIDIALFFSQFSKHLIMMFVGTNPIFGTGKNLENGLANYIN